MLPGALLSLIHKQLDVIERNQGVIMAKIDELNAKVAELHAALAAEKEEVGTAIQGLNAQITALQEQIGTGGTSDADIQGVIDQLDTIKTNLTKVYEAPAPNPPEDTQPPPPVVDVGV